MEKTNDARPWIYVGSAEKKQICRASKAKIILLKFQNWISAFANVSKDLTTLDQEVKQS